MNSQKSKRTHGVWEKNKQDNNEKIDAGRRIIIAGGVSAAAAVLTSNSATVLGASSGSVEARISSLGIELPSMPSPVANYVPYKVSGNLAYIAGQIPMEAGVLLSPGKVPSQVSVERARQAATQCCLNILAALKEACDGDLDRVSACLRLEGFVACDDDFTNQPTIINAASDLIVEIFGERGKHTRIAVGANTLPLNACVEISAVFSIS
jgi:enamine deaminase RidA (YjgF/YER057c/UK114 family)